MKTVSHFFLCFALGYSLLNGCKPSPDPVTPTATSPAVGASTAPTPPTEQAMSLAGTISTDGGGAITQHGHAYSETNKIPTVADSKTELGTNAGPFPATFASALTGLKINTLYYVRAYATNSVGISYGPVLEVKTGVNPAPTIASIQPAVGSAGTQVLITGTNFNPALSSNTVKFNGKSAKILAVNATTLTVEVPEKAGIGPLSVETAGQTANSGTVFNFLYSATTEKVAGDFKYPQNLVLDGKGNIYVPDRGNGQIKMIRPNGSVVTIAGTTPASLNGKVYGVRGSLARFTVITGLAVDAAGENLYAVDENTLTGAFGGYVLKIDLTTTNYFVQQLGDYQLGHPAAIRLDEANKLLYINSFTTTTLAGFVRTMKTDGTDLKTIMGSASAVGFNPISSGEIDGPSARLKVPMGSFLTKDGQFYYFTDEHNHAIRVYNTVTKKVKTIAGTGITGNPETYAGDQFSNAEVTFTQPTGIALDSEGRIYVTEWKASRTLRVYDPKSDKWQTLLANLRSPYGLVINSKDELFFTEYTGTNDSVIKVKIR